MQEGSGKRTSMRLAFGEGEYIGMRTAADRLRDEYPTAPADVIAETAVEEMRELLGQPPVEQQQSSEPDWQAQFDNYN